MSDIIQGFAPFYSADSRVLILGSFPSVKSRAQNFYYGNPQNAFWRIVSSFFGEDAPQIVEDKKDFLLRRRIALWDIVQSCQIKGSADASIKNFTVANLGEVLQNCDICAILLNGGKAAELYFKHYADIPLPAIKLPSTSPANAHPKKEAWHDALGRAFATT